MLHFNGSGSGGGQGKDLLPVTGNPPKPHCSLSCFASLTEVVGERTTGSRIKPFSNRLTLRTISAWFSAEQLWWITPRPPRRAMCIAIECSVTVSIGEERRGVFSEIRFVTGVSRATSEAGKPKGKYQRQASRKGAEAVPMYPGSTKKSL